MLPPWLIFSHFPSIIVMAWSPPPPPPPPQFLSLFPAVAVKAREEIRSELRGARLDKNSRCQGTTPTNSSVTIPTNSSVTMPTNSSVTMPTNGCEASAFISSPCSTSASVPCNDVSEINLCGRVMETGHTLQPDCSTSAQFADGGNGCSLSEAERLGKYWGRHLAENDSLQNEVEEKEEKIIPREQDSEEEEVLEDEDVPVTLERYRVYGIYELDFRRDMCIHASFCTLLSYFFLFLYPSPSPFSLFLSFLLPLLFSSLFSSSLFSSSLFSSSLFSSSLPFLLPSLSSFFLPSLLLSSPPLPSFFPLSSITSSLLSSPLSLFFLPWPLSSFLTFF